MVGGSNNSLLSFSFVHLAFLFLLFLFLSLFFFLFCFLFFSFCFIIYSCFNFFKSKLVRSTSTCYLNRLFQLLFVKLFVIYFNILNLWWRLKTRVGGSHGKDTSQFWPTSYSAIIYWMLSFISPFTKVQYV